jgi:hypothetical protein
MDVVMDDSISFYRKVSCEDDPSNNNYDWLGFFIDNVEIERWDGEMDWQRMAYPVTAGQHTFKWVYTKDYSVSSGADAAWIDYIIFPAVAPAVSVGEPAAFSGVDFRIMPNPARELASLYVDLPASSQVSVEIIDLAGNRMMQVIHDKVLPAGSSRVKLETGNLVPGMYFCVLTANGGQVTKKLIISK